MPIGPLILTSEVRTRLEAEAQYAFIKQIYLSKGLYPRDNANFEQAITVVGIVCLGLDWTAHLTIVDDPAIYVVHYNSTTSEFTVKIYDQKDPDHIPAKE